MYGWEKCNLIGKTCILTKGKPLNVENKKTLKIKLIYAYL